MRNIQLSGTEKYSRSTNIPRTTESLQQIIHGLYPTAKCGSTVQPPFLVRFVHYDFLSCFDLNWASRNGKDENLIGNTYVCKRLELLQVGFAMGMFNMRIFFAYAIHPGAIAAAQAFNRSLEPLDSKISKYLNGNPIRVDGKPRASGVMDTVSCSIPTIFFYAII